MASREHETNGDPYLPPNTVHTLLSLPGVDQYLVKTIIDGIPVGDFPKEPIIKLVNEYLLSFGKVTVQTLIDQIHATNGEYGD